MADSDSGDPATDGTGGEDSGAGFEEAVAAMLKRSSAQDHGGTGRQAKRPRREATLLDLPIPVVYNGVDDVTVWDPDAVYTLRLKCRVVGSLMGVVPGFASQVEYASIPLRLMPEEVTLCLSRGFIRLVAATPGDFAAPDLSEAGLAAYVDAFGLNSINPEFVAPAQAAVAAVAAVAAALNPEESDDPLGSAGANDEGDDGSLDLSATPPPERRVEWLRRRRARRTVAKAKDKEQFGVNGRVLMEHFNGSRLSGFRDAGEAHHEVDWQWPHTGEERTRYRVFEHLWERGLSITEGCKFGGQYLCYDGDPFAVHGAFVVVLKEADEPISPLEIVALGRLGVTVKKTPVIATVDADGEVKYMSLAWEGL